MKHYEEDEDGVTLHFDHGQPLVHGKLLVGADGYFSKVRTQCLNDGPPNFSVSCSLSHHNFLIDCTLYHPSFSVSCTLDDSNVLVSWTPSHELDR